jgi:predicted transcriptional regulator
MKRTTIMIDEELFYDLQQIARRQEQSASGVIREALAAYVAEQRRRVADDNPLLAIAGLGESSEPMDLADGGDETLLRQGSEPMGSWGAAPPGAPRTGLSSRQAEGGAADDGNS